MKPDRKKVIEGLEEVIAEAVYPDRPRKFMMSLELAEDALALLKEQEPVKPLILVKDAALSNGAKYLCGKCGGSFFHQKVNFCPWCGKVVNWE